MSSTKGVNQQLSEKLKTGEYKERSEPRSYGALVLGNEEIEAVTRVIKSKKLTRDSLSTDNENDKFEKEAASFIGVKFARATSSGTAALIVGLRALGIKAGDQVLVPSYTWMATATSVMAVGASPVVVDIDEEFMSLDVQAAEKLFNPSVKAMIVVHMNGVPLDMDKYVQFCKKQNIFLIEDCSQCIGGKCHGKTVGVSGAFGVWSLGSNTTITTGEGGLFFTNDEQLYKKAVVASSLDLFLPEVKRLTVFEKHTMSELNAALGRAQLKRINGITEKLRLLKQAAIHKFTVHPQSIAKLVKESCKGGDCGSTLRILFKSRDLAEKAKQYLDQQKSSVSSSELGSGSFELLFEPNVIDLNLSCWWDQVPAQKQGEKSREICSRTMVLRFNFDMNEEEAAKLGDQLGAAVHYVAEHGSTA